MAEIKVKGRDRPIYTNPSWVTLLPNEDDQWLIASPFLQYSLGPKPGCLELDMPLQEALDELNAAMNDDRPRTLLELIDAENKKPK
jgi:hypothetical protein